MGKGRKRKNENVILTSLTDFYRKYCVYIHIITLIAITLFFSQRFLAPGYEPILRNDIVWHYSMVHYFHENYNGHYDFWWDYQGGGTSFFLYYQTVPTLIPNLITEFFGFDILFTFKLSIIFGLVLFYLGFYFLSFRLMNDKHIAFLSSLLLFVIGFKDYYSISGIINVSYSGNYTFLYGAAFAFYFLGMILSKNFNANDFFTASILGSLSLLSNPLSSVFAFILAVGLIFFMKRKIFRYLTFVSIALLSAFWMLPYLIGKVGTWSPVGKTDMLLQFLLGNLFNNWFFNIFVVIGLLFVFFKFRAKRHLILLIPISMIIASGVLKKLPTYLFPYAQNFQWYRAMYLVYAFAAFFIAVAFVQLARFKKLMPLMVILFIAFSGAEFNKIYDMSVKHEYLNRQQIENFFAFVKENVDVNRLGLEHFSDYYGVFGFSSEHIYTLIPIIANTTIYSYTPAVHVPYFSNTDFITHANTLNNTSLLNDSGIESILVVKEDLAQKIKNTSGFQLVAENNSFYLFNVINASGIFVSDENIEMEKVSPEMYCFSLPEDQETADIILKITSYPNWKLTQEGKIYEISHNFMNILIKKNSCIKYIPTISIYYILSALSFLSLIVFVIFLGNNEKLRKYIYKF